MAIFSTKTGSEGVSVRKEKRKRDGRGGGGGGRGGGGGMGFSLLSKTTEIVCIVGKINNMMLCVKNHVNMCLRDILTWKL